ncbi:helix-turn-helix transcriptional regulator [Rothia sp. ZJ1223]|uniref:ArsR/SmtB family transcription factor n=1 Tax=Rothia sp. ZJ1223 TaxID=2811098 RepID=UPI00195C31F2|nr:metalloregulator ArsR/SmtB family transcription factor [Rothia sp. ZJ1223]MBM7051951.1 metalloregulator ArsR/SmtB family transcription factor [Rothia sp. ZJ1223]
MIDDVFAVIADPTRRQILRVLASGETPVGTLVEELGVSQPTVSKHLKVLRTAGLVTTRAQGQKRLYSLTPEPLSKVTLWIETLNKIAGRTPGSFAGAEATHAVAPGVVSLAASEARSGAEDEKTQSPQPQEQAETSVEETEPMLEDADASADQDAATVEQGREGADTAGEENQAVLAQTQVESEPDPEISVEKGEASTDPATVPQVGELDEDVISSVAENIAESLTSAEQIETTDQPVSKSVELGETEPSQGAVYFSPMTPFTPVPVKAADDAPAADSGEWVEEQADMPSPEEAPATLAPRQLTQEGETKATAPQYDQYRGKTVQHDSTLTGSARHDASQSSDGSLDDELASEAEADLYNVGALRQSIAPADDSLTVVLRDDGGVESVPQVAEATENPETPDDFVPDYEVVTPDDEPKGLLSAFSRLRRRRSR